MLQRIDALRPFIGIFETLTALGFTMMLCGACMPLFSYLRPDPRLKRATIALANPAAAAAAAQQQAAADEPVADTWLASLKFWLVSMATDHGQLCAVLFGLMAFIISNIIIVHFQGDDPNQMMPWPRYGAPAETFPDFLVRFFFIPGTHPYHCCHTMIL